MAATDVEICSNALLLLGEKTINSFDDTDGQTAATCGALYGMLVNGWLACYPWTFCKTKMQLSRLVDAPISGWQYKYQLPPDRLIATWAVFDSAGVNAAPIQTFDIQGETLLTNAEAIWLDYTARPDESKWPPYFTLFAVHALAATFAIAITQDKSMFEVYQSKAFGTPGQAGLGGLWDMATRQDALTKPSFPIVQSPLVDARW